MSRTYTFDPGSGMAIIPEGEIRRPDGRVNFDHVRRVYAAMMPEILHARDRWIDPYFVDWVSAFTPIETQMWYLVRAQPMPYYPQLPVGRYFVDFGNPVHRIAIECDGRAWHDVKRDEARDAEMGELGWRVFRFSGWACFNMPRLPDLRAWGVGCTAAESLGIGEARIGESREAFKRRIELEIARRERGDAPPNPREDHHDPGLETLDT
jgi:hypothetical protein